MSLFSKRNREPVKTFRCDVPEMVRSRVLYTLEELAECNHNGSLDGLLHDVGDILLKEYGGLHQSSYRAARRSDHPIIEHFLSVSDEMALDFIEASFHSFSHGPGKEGVNRINEIFREEGIGYVLTPWIEIEDKEGKNGPIPFLHMKKIEITYPQFIRKTDNYIHKEVVMPALDALAKPIFKVANEEMLKAHASFRAGDWPNAITASGSAFESVMKTICTQKKWRFDADKDTCAKLVEICNEHNLFPSFYVEGLKAIGRIRNNLGDAHGRGPLPKSEATSELAEHMIHSTSANILLLARLAGIE